MGREQGAQAWRNFSATDREREINLRDFILSNVAPYSGGSEFFAQPTRRTLAERDRLQPYFRKETRKGVLGKRVPAVPTGRADSVHNRVASCGVAAAMANSRSVALEREDV